MVWNKRGQFFLIAALVTIMILFTLTVKYNTIRQTVALEDFAELSEGYNTEQPKVINLAIAEGDDEAAALQKFTKEYIEFAQGREPSFGVIYAYRDSKGGIHIVNGRAGVALNLEFKDPKTGEKAQIQLLSTGTPVGGTIGLNIEGSQFGTTVKTDIANFGKQLTQADLTSLDKLVIISGSSCPAPIGCQITLPQEFKASATTVISGEQPVLGGPDIVKITQKNI